MAGKTRGKPIRLAKVFGGVNEAGQKRAEAARSLKVDDYGRLRAENAFRSKLACCSTQSMLSDGRCFVQGAASFCGLTTARVNPFT